MSPGPFVALLSRRPQTRSDRLAGFIRKLNEQRALACLFESATLLVLGAPTSPHVLTPDGEGLIWGHLFDRATGDRVSNAKAGDMDGPAERFVEDYWGGYVAFRTRNAAAEALRDPSGAIPCYHVTVDGVHILTSDPSLLVDAGLIQAEIDWTIVCHALVYRDLLPARTALRGISEVLPGMVLWVLPTGSETRCAWTPWRFTEAQDEISDSATAVEAVRYTTRQCLKAWDNSIHLPIVEISGGLDSAIVAAGLHRNQSRPVGITFGPAPGDPDETPYARAVASHLGIALTTGVPELAAVDLFHSDAGDLARPCARNFLQAFDRPNQGLAVRVGADAFFSGGGGDNVFCYLRSALPAVDRLKRHGLNRDLLVTIGDLATLAETTVWNVAMRTARMAFRRGAPEPWPMEGRFLSTTAMADPPLPAGHPWLDAPVDALPGKRAHVTSLIGVQNHLAGHGRSAFAPIISPLLSQPLVEVCLAIPSWLWCAGGNNRAIARVAFAGALPASVIARRTKGAFEGFCTRLVDANRVSLRALLLEGALAREKLLDTNAIAACLARETLGSTDVIRLLMLADVEAWARAWEAKPSSIVRPSVP